MFGTRRVESEVFMRACMSSCSRDYLGHQASPASTKGVRRVGGVGGRLLGAHLPY